jgi:hypothetical protein
MNNWRKTMRFKNKNMIILFSALLSSNAHAEKSFYFLDENKDGKLSHEEYMSGLELNMDKVKSFFDQEGRLIVQAGGASTAHEDKEKEKDIKRAKVRFKQLDLNKDKFLQDEEFYPDGQGTLAFAAVDTNKDRQLSKEEIVAAAPPKRKRALSFMVKRLDQNFDKLLDYNEYVGRPYFEVELKEYAAAKAAKTKK